MPDASDPKNGNTLSPMAAKLRRLVLFERARVALGNATRLADAIGIGRRGVNLKLGAERGISDRDLTAVIAALDARAAVISALADDMRALIAPASKLR